MDDQKLQFEYLISAEGDLARTNIYALNHYVVGYSLGNHRSTASMGNESNKRAAGGIGFQVSFFKEVRDDVSRHALTVAGDLSGAATLGPPLSAGLRVVSGMNLWAGSPSALPLRYEGAFGAEGRSAQAMRP